MRRSGGVVLSILLGAAAALQARASKRRAQRDGAAKRSMHVPLVLLALGAALLGGTRHNAQAAQMSGFKLSPLPIAQANAPFTGIDGFAPPAYRERPLRHSLVLRFSQPLRGA